MEIEISEIGVGSGGILVVGIVWGISMDGIGILGMGRVLMIYGGSVAGGGLVAPMDRYPGISGV